MQQKKYKLTQEKYDALKQELEYLRTVREKEVAEQIKEARSFGDLSENSEYDEAKNEQGRLYSRIAELENLINHSEVMEERVMGGDIVSTGCKVTVKCEETGESTEFSIVVSQESDPLNFCIADDSPLGRELVGKKVGDKVLVIAPIGQRHYTIEKISID